MTGSQAPSWSATWFGGEHVTVAEPPAFKCRFCWQPINLQDTREICETTQSQVHPECHNDECVDPRCRYLVCTFDRCNDLTECDWCGGLACDRHLAHAHDACDSV